MMASEEPMVEVPIVLASSWEGALNSLAIIDTHPVHVSHCISTEFEVRTVLDIGANGILLVVDEVLGESVTTAHQLTPHPSK
jgi:hypothetical protein